MSSRKAWKLILLLLAVVFLLLFSLSRLLEQQVQRLAGALAGEIQQRYGWSISYQAAYYRLFNSVLLRGVRVAQGDTFAVQIEQVQLSYRLHLRGVSKGAILSAVTVDEADVMLRTRAGAAPMEELQLPPLPFFLLANRTRIRWYGPEVTLDLSLSTLSMNPESGVGELRTRGQLALSNQQAEIFFADFSGEGFIQARQSIGQLQLLLTEGRVQSLQLRPLLVQLDLSARQLEIRNQQHEEKLDFLLSVRFADGALRISSLFHRLRGADLLLSESPFYAEEWASQPVRGAFSLQQGGGTALRYDFRLEHGDSARFLRAVGEGDSEKIRLDDFVFNLSSTLKVVFQGEIFYRLLHSHGRVDFTWRIAGQELLGQVLLLAEGAESVRVSSSGLLLNRRSGLAFQALLSRAKAQDLDLQLQTSYRGKNLLVLQALLSLSAKRWATVSFQTAKEGLHFSLLSDLAIKGWPAALDSFVLWGDGQSYLLRDGWELSIPQLLLRASQPYPLELRSSLRMANGAFYLNRLQLQVLQNPTGLNTPLEGDIWGRLTAGTFQGMLLGQRFNLDWRLLDEVLYLREDKLRASLTRDSFWFELDGLLLPWKGQPFIRTSGRIQILPREQWRVDVSDLALELLQQNRMLPERVRLQASMGINGLEIEPLVWEQFGTEYRGKAFVQAREGGYIAELQLGNATEGITLEADYQDPEHFWVNSDLSFRLERLTGNPLLQGQLVSQLRLDKEGSLQLGGDVQLRDASLWERNAALRFHFLYRDGSLAMSEFFGRYSGIQLERAALSYLAAAQQSHFSVDYRLATAQGWLPGAIAGKVTFQQALPAALRAGRIPSFQGLLQLGELSWGRKRLIPASVLELAWKDGGLRLAETRTNSFFLFYREGRFDLRLDQPFPLMLRFAGHYANQRFSQATLLLRLEADLLNLFSPRDRSLGLPIYDIAGGELSAALRLEGKATDPEIFGNLQLSKLELATPYLSERPQAFDLVFVAQQHVLFLQPVTLRFGRSTVMLPGYEEDYLRLRNLLPERYYLKIVTAGSGLPAQYRIKGVSFKGVVAGEVLVSGDNEQGQLNGAVSLEELLIEMKKTDVVQAAPLPSKSGTYPFTAALRMRTGKKVLFRQDPFVEARGQPDDLVVLNYNVHDNSGILSGVVHFPEARVGSASLGYLSEGSGSLTFNELLPAFNPLLQFSSNISVMSSQGIPVALAMNYRGYLSNLVEGSFPELSSNPPVSEEEAKVLLLSHNLGIKDMANIWTTLPSLALQMGEDAFSRQISEFLQEQVDFIDRVDIRTSVLSKLVLHQLSDGTAPTDVRELLRYFDGSKISFSSYLDPQNNLLLTAGVRSSYQPPSTDEPFSTSSMQLIPEMGLTFISPFATISAQLGFKQFKQRIVPESSISLEWAMRF